MKRKNIIRKNKMAQEKKKSKRRKEKKNSQEKGKTFGEYVSIFKLLLIAFCLDLFSAMLCIGTLSGTSMNAKEFILCEIKSERVIKPIYYRSFPFGEEIKLARKITLSGKADIRTIAELHDLIGTSFAKSLFKFIRECGLEKAGDRMQGKSRYKIPVGFHGQTIYHKESGIRKGVPRATTMQIGEPIFLAEISGFPVIYDFRKSDISAGGRGAPLSPLIHHVLFAKKGKITIVVNLGGIANMTYLYEDDFSKAKGEDIGPANALSDHLCQKLLRIKYDKDGKIAKTGEINLQIFTETINFLRENMRGKKSIGEEVEKAKNLVYELVKKDKKLKPSDAVRTALEVSVYFIKEKISRKKADVVVLCGGGAKNKFFVKRLEEELAPLPLTISEEFGIPPEYVEPILFAYLGYLRMKKKRIYMRNITGAKYPYLPGKICEV